MTQNQPELDGAVFQTTRWTIVARVASTDELERRTALEQLACTYWPAVYSWLRQSGLDRADAADATQGFFADIVLDRELFAQADSAKGRLRTLLLVSLKRYVVDRYRRNAARGGRQPLLTVDDFAREERICSRGMSTDPDSAFEQRWAVEVLWEALRRTEKQLERVGRNAQWKIFELRVLGPTIYGAGAVPLKTLAEMYGYRTPGDVAAVVQSVKKRVRTFLREVVWETISDAELGEKELLEVMGSIE